MTSLAAKVDALLAQEKEAGARQLQQRANEAAAARAREEVARAAVPPLRREP